MNNTKRLAKNTIALTFASIVPKVFTIVFTVYAARKLGSMGLGEYAIATSVVGLFSVFTELGLNNLFVREVARHKDKAGYYLGSMLVLKACLSVTVLLLIGLVTKLLGYSDVVEQTIYLLALALVFSSFSSLLTSLFQAYEEMEFSAVLGILNSAVLTVGGVAVLSLGYGVMGLGGVAILAAAVVLIAALIIIAQKFKFGRLKLNKAFLGQILKEAVPFAVINILITIYHRTDMVLLSKLPITGAGNEVAVGLYSASYKFVDTLQMVPAIVTGAAFPFFSRLYLENQPKFYSTFQRILKYLVVLGIPMAVGTTLLAEPIIKLAYGADFIRSAASLKILIWAVSIIFVNSLLASVLTSMGKMKVLAVVIGMNVLFSLTSNFILIPTWGLGLSFIGASLTTLLTEVLGFALVLWYFSRHLQSINFVAVARKPLIAALLMGGFILLVGRHLLFSLLMSPLIYFGLLYFLQAFDEEDKKILVNLLAFKK